MPVQLAAPVHSRPVLKNRVVHAVLALIQERGLKAGDQLPPIRELAAFLEVPPTMIRDALLQAQTMGLVRIVPRGGAFVQSPSYAPLVDALASTLQPALTQDDPNLVHLIEARNLLEIDMVGSAAQRRRLEDLLPVRASLEAMVQVRDLGDLAEYIEHDIRFHRAIARLSGNTVLETIHHALLELLLNYLAKQSWTAERRDRTNRAHAAIYAALVAGDPDQARDAMRTHLSFSTVLLDVQTPPELDPPKKRR